MEFWIFHQQIVEMKFKHKILLELGENNTGLTHSVLEFLYGIKSKDSRMVLECLSDYVKDEETICLTSFIWRLCMY